MSLISTRYFTSDIFGAGQITNRLREVTALFTSDVNPVHLALGRDISSSVHESKDPASWSDIEPVTDLGAESLLLRAWFGTARAGRLHFSLGGERGATRLTIAAPSVEKSEELFTAIIRGLNLTEIPDPHDHLQELLEAYQLPADDFSNAVSSPDLAQILSNRWEESYLSQYAGAYLSSLVMLGSVLEGALLDKVEHNPEEANRAKSSPSKQGDVLQFHEWSFENLIQVARECGWIDSDVGDFSSALRDYRNLVHPSVQRRKQIYPDSGTCDISREVVRAALEDLAR
jgi:hypothetical protein